MHSSATACEQASGQPGSRLKVLESASDARLMETEAVTNGRPEVQHADSAFTLELSVAEAQALRSWLLKPAADGSSTMDDGVLKPVMVKLGSELDFRDGVATVRQELEQAGLPTAILTDEQVADLGRRIVENKPRLSHTHA